SQHLPACVIRHRMTKISDNPVPKPWIDVLSRHLQLLTERKIMMQVAELNLTKKMAVHTPIEIPTKHKIRSNVHVSQILSLRPSLRNSYSQVRISLSPLLHRVVDHRRAIESVLQSCVDLRKPSGIHEVRPRRMRAFVLVIQVIQFRSSGI